MTINQFNNKNNIKYLNDKLHGFIQEKDFLFNKILTINEYINFHISKKDFYLNYINQIQNNCNYYHPDQYNFELHVNSKELNMAETSLYFGHEEMKKLNSKNSEIENKITNLERLLDIEKIIILQNLFRQKRENIRNKSATKIQSLFRCSKLRKSFIKKIGEKYYATKIACNVIKNLINRTMNIVKKKHFDLVKKIKNDENTKMLENKNNNIIKKDIVKKILDKNTKNESLNLVTNKVNSKKKSKKKTKKKKKKKKFHEEDKDYSFLKKEIEKNKNICANIIINFFRIVKAKNKKFKILDKHANTIIRFFKKIKPNNYSKNKKITVELVKKSISICKIIKEKSNILKNKLNEIQLLFNFLVKDNFYQEDYFDSLKFSMKTIYKFYQKFLNINDENIIEVEYLKLHNRITICKNFLINYKDRVLFFHHKMNLCLNVRKYLKLVIADHKITDKIIHEGYSIVDNICTYPFVNKDTEYYNNFVEKITKTLVINYSDKNKKKSLFKIVIISIIFEYLSLLTDISINLNCYNLENYEFREYDENCKTVYVEFIKCSYEKYKKFLKDISDENFLAKFKSKDNLSYELN